MTDSRLQNILDKLDKAYGTEKKMYLEYNTPWQLLFATILSAQCTDARVNIVTRDLYKKYDSLEKFASASIAEMERDIHSIGFYHNKAKNLIACARKLLSDFTIVEPIRLFCQLTNSFQRGQRPFNRAFLVTSHEKNTKEECRRRELTY